jgi:hypothetical protein
VANGLNLELDKKLHLENSAAYGYSFRLTKNVRGLRSSVLCSCSTGIRTLEPSATSVNTSSSGRSSPEFISQRPSLRTSPWCIKIKSDSKGHHNGGACVFAKLCREVVKEKDEVAVFAKDQYREHLLKGDHDLCAKIWGHCRLQ